MTTKFFSAAALLLVASAAAAQSPAAGSRWSAYAGCWEPAAAEGMVSVTTSRVCVVPTSANGADLLSVVDNKITERTHVEADGARHEVKRQGCAGWESAEWSADGRRVYMTSDQKCDAVDAAGRVISVDVVSAGLERKASGMFAIGPTGQWTNVVNVSASGGQGLRVIRYTPVRVDSILPDEIVKALGNREMFFGTARIGSRARVTIDNVIEASKKVDAQVVDAWLAMSQEKFDLDANALVHLADSGVPAQTIDVMVAVSNPGVFALAANAGGVSATETAAPLASRSTRNECLKQIMDPWGYYYDYGCDPYRGYGYRGYYGYDPYYNPYSRYGYGYNGYNYGFNYGYNGTPVVVYVIGSPTDPNAPKHGKMTRSGYTTGGSSSSSGSIADDRPRSAQPMSSSSSSSGTSSSSSSSSSGSGEVRTAHPKPPTP